MAEQDRWMMQGSIENVDPERRMVYCYATTDSVDSQGETIDLAASFDAVDEYMKHRSVGEMHDPLKAAGIAPIIEKRPGKGVWVGINVTDDQAWKKVTTGTYKGVSIWGKPLARDPDNPKRITKYKLAKIDLVNVPSNPDCYFAGYTIAKFDALAPDGADGGKVSMAEETTQNPPAEQTASAPPASTGDAEKFSKELAEKTAQIAQLEAQMAAFKDEQAKSNEMSKQILARLDSIIPDVRKMHVEQQPGEDDIAKSIAEKVKSQDIGSLTTQMLAGMKRK